MQRNRTINLQEREKNKFTTFLIGYLTAKNLPVPNDKTPSSPIASPFLMAHFLFLYYQTPRLLTTPGMWMDGGLTKQWWVHSSLGNSHPMR
jgi:hypothetical protein